MPDTLVSSDLNFGQLPVTGFGCTFSDGGFGATWVRVAGELNDASAPQLASTLTQATQLARTVVIDLRGLTGVDSSGVSAIVVAGQRARRAGRRLVVVRGRSQAERLSTLSGALHAQEIVDLAANEPLVPALLQIARNDWSGKHILLSHKEDAWALERASS
jgi:anti-anti-sigma factor